MNIWRIRRNKVLTVKCGICCRTSFVTLDAVGTACSTEERIWKEIFVWKEDENIWTVQSARGELAMAAKSVSYCIRKAESMPMLTVHLHRPAKSPCSYGVNGPWVQTDFGVLFLHRTLFWRVHSCRSERFTQTKNCEKRTNFLCVRHHHTSAALVDKKGACRRCHIHSSSGLPSPIYTWPWKDTSQTDKRPCMSRLLPDCTPGMK